MVVTREDVETADKYGKYDAALRAQIVANAEFEDAHKKRHESFLVEKKERDEKKFRLGAELARAGRAIDKIEFEIPAEIRKELQASEYEFNEASKKTVEFGQVLRDLDRSIADLKKRGLTKEQAKTTIDSQTEVAEKLKAHKLEVKRLEARLAKARTEHKAAAAAVRKAAYITVPK